MPKSQDDLFDQKVCNCLRWVNALGERYPGVPELLAKFGFDATALLADRQARETFITGKLPLLVTSSESSIASTIIVRNFFETMNEDQRMEFLRTVFAPAVRHYADLFVTVANFLECPDNAKQISDDMRQIGGYTTLFTEQYLKRK